jgi:hypothetical protein
MSDSWQTDRHSATQFESAWIAARRQASLLKRDVKTPTLRYFANE